MPDRPVSFPPPKLRRRNLSFSLACLPSLLLSAQLNPFQPYHVLHIAFIRWTLSFPSQPRVPWWTASIVCASPVLV